MSKKSISIGQKFNFLTILKLPLKGRVLCQCDCGTIKSMRTYSVTSNKTKSCGCYSRSAASKRMSSSNKKYDVDITHKTYNSWKVIKRSKEVCSEWIDDYEEFYNWSMKNGWKDGLVLKQHDSSQPCFPANCYWSKRTSSPQNSEKCKSTNLKKYGVEHYTQTKEYREKYTQTCLEKYGVDHASKSDIVKDKIKTTNLEKYGFECASQNDIVKAKIRQTCIDKYGKPCSLSNIMVQEKSKQTCLKKYGQESYHSPSNKEQNVLLKWISQYGQFTTNRTILEGKEIDFYDKELGLGIEYNGLYWHNELSPTPRGCLYHWNKYNKCLIKGVRLITIFSDEWLFRQQQVKGFLLSVLGVNEKIYGRKCSVVQITNRVAKKFIEEYHIQGCNRFPKAAFGLYDTDNTLVGAMSINVHHRNKNVCVLDRLVFKQGVSVVGGASKLFKLARQWCVDNNIKQLITWSDNRWSQGNIYDVLGFEFDKELKPDYSYVKLSYPRKRISKQSMRKSKTGCPEHITEKQWCINNGYAQIWDCGKKRFVYNF